MNKNFEKKKELHALLKKEYIKQENFFFKTERNPSQLQNDYDDIFKTNSRIQVF